MTRNNTHNNTHNYISNTSNAINMNQQLQQLGQVQKIQQVQKVQQNQVSEVNDILSNTRHNTSGTMQSNSKHAQKTIVHSQEFDNSVIVCCAHPDDEALGLGGTIAQYTKQSIPVIVVLFTDGESSHPFHKKEYVQKIRREEISGAGKVLGVSKIIHLGLRDGSLTTDVKKPLVKQLLVDIFEQYHPQKVFTHSRDDMLYPDHVAVHKVTISAVKEYRDKQLELTHLSSIRASHSQESKLSDMQTVEVYTFNIWGMTLFDTFAPQLLVDITSSFDKKIRAIEQFKSQKLAIAQLLPTIVYKAVQAGSKINVQYAESFRKVRI
jgi:N-acetylglucosamine malate deacetylase 2